MEQKIELERKLKELQALNDELHGEQDQHIADLEKQNSDLQDQLKAL